MTFLMAGAIATRIAQACAALLIAGCKGDAERPKAAEAVSPEQELTAEAFHRDYLGLTGAALLTRYAEGVLVTGTIDQVVEQGAPEGLEVGLAVPGRPPGEGIALRFDDGGVRMRRRTPAVGDSITVRCRVGGRQDALVFLLDCQPP
jgi:hypothetical protein